MLKSYYNARRKGGGGAAPSNGYNIAGLCLMVVLVGLLVAAVVKLYTTKAADPTVVDATKTTTTSNLPTGFEKFDDGAVVTNPFGSTTVRHTFRTVYGMGTRDVLADTKWPVEDGTVFFNITLEALMTPLGVTDAEGSTRYKVQVNGVATPEEISVQDITHTTLTGDTDVHEDALPEIQVKSTYAGGEHLIQVRVPPAAAALPRRYEYSVKMVVSYN